METYDSNDRAHWVHTAVSRYERSLVRYTSQITEDVERARDVVQDTFLRLCKQDPEKLDDHLAEWLYTVCRNRALDVREKEKRMKTMTAQQHAAQQGREARQAIAAEQSEMAGRVLEFVGTLSENQQEVVRLKFQNGLSYKEISAITQLSVSNVGYLIHTAVKKLRQELRQEWA